MVKKRGDFAGALKNLFPSGKSIFLAYDQGLEHGPTDFNETNIDPAYIIDIAKKGKVDAMIFHKGIARSYSSEIKKSGIPLIVKLNGKTSLVNGDPISRQICSVDDAISLGAIAVGYTIYFGSEHESDMFKDFEKIESEAHAKGLPVIVWAYPRGRSLEGKNPNEIMAYVARASFELGADVVKIIPTGDIGALAWTVKSAARAKVIMAGGSKKSEEQLLSSVCDSSGTGIFGLAIGRNVWQDEDPVGLIKKLRENLLK